MKLETKAEMRKFAVCQTFVCFHVGVYSKYAC
jgi:hypothetical protein